MNRNSVGRGTMTIILAVTLGASVQAHTLWVDVHVGNNATAQLDRIQRPWKTLTAAKAAAAAGDTIIVHPGTYDEKNLLKDGVDWHFTVGAIVEYTGRANGGIFDDSATGANSVVRAVISGSGEFHRLGSGSSGDVFKIWQPGSKVTATFYRATGIARGLAVAGDASTALIASFDSIETSDGALDCVGGYMYANGRRAVCNNIGHENDGGVAEIHLDYLEGGAQGMWIATTPGPTSRYYVNHIVGEENGIQHAWGDAIVVADLIESTTDATVLASGTSLRVRGARIVNHGASPAVYNWIADLELQDCILEPGAGAVEVGGATARFLGGRNSKAFLSAQATLANFLAIEEPTSNVRIGDFVKLTTGNAYLLNDHEASAAGSYTLLVP